MVLWWKDIIIVHSVLFNSWRRIIAHALSHSMTGMCCSAITNLIRKQDYRGFDSVIFIPRLDVGSAEIQSNMFMIGSWTWCPQNGICTHMCSMILKILQIQPDWIVVMRIRGSNLTANTKCAELCKNAPCPSECFTKCVEACLKGKPSPLPIFAPPIKKPSVPKSIPSLLKDVMKKIIDVMKP